LNNYSNNKYKERARLLRKNMTQEERKIWYLFLRKNKYRFLRQKIINNYILDFYCPKQKLAVEIDGWQHYTTEGTEYDKIRTNILNAHGIKVIRFSNYEINYKFKEVCEFIDNELKTLSHLR